MMALQVAGGTGCVLPPLHARRRAFRPPRAASAAAAAAAAKEEEDGKVELGGSGVAVTKLGIGAWSWGDTTYWNEFQWDGTCSVLGGPPRQFLIQDSLSSVPFRCRLIAAATLLRSFTFQFSIFSLWHQAIC